MTAVAVPGLGILLDLRFLVQAVEMMYSIEACNFLFFFSFFSPSPLWYILLRLGVFLCYIFFW